MIKKNKPNKKKSYEKKIIEKLLLMVPVANL